jgi:hypothetical protein
MVEMFEKLYLGEDIFTLDRLEMQRSYICIIHKLINFPKMRHLNIQSLNVEITSIDTKKEYH